MKVIAVVLMLFCFFQIAFAEEGHEVIVSVIEARSTSLTDTRVKPLTKIRADFFPGGKNIGISYDFGYRHPRFFVLKPFSADHSELMHSLGLVVRLLDEGRFQPMVRAGAMRYIGRTTVHRFDEKLIDAHNSKFIPTVSFSVNVQPWKRSRFVLTPEVAASGWPRPQWNIGIGAGYDFHFGGGSK